MDTVNQKNSRQFQEITSAYFPELKYFIGTALLFGNLGILFGALNAFRLGGVYPVDEIHQTHWTSTLLGGVTLLMLGQIFYFFSHINGEKSKYHRYTLVVLVFWVIGVLSNYMIVWSNNPDIYLTISEIIFKVAMVIFTLLILSFFTNPIFRANMKRNKTSYLILSGVLWLLFAMIFFTIKNSALNRVFLTSYVYGFFSLTLFGSLGYVLPILYGQRARSDFSVKLEFIFLNLAAVVLVIYDKYRTLVPSFFGIFAPVIWAIVGLFFIFWLFDLLYRSGMNVPLVGQLIAFIMLSFFVFDTFMKNTFPQWVYTSHVHFMFLGTILITIVSIGSKILISQYGSPDEESIDMSDLFGKKNRLTTYSIAVAILLVSGILFAFTIQDFVLAGWFGVTLFVAVIIIEIFYFRAHKK